MSELTGQSLIAGGAPPRDGDNATFCGVNPATGEGLDPEYHAATPAQVERAVELAATAYQQYRDIPGSRRGEFLRAIAANVEARVDDLVERIGQETALPEQRVRGETGRTAGQLRMFAEMIEEGSWVDARIDPALPERQPLPRPDIRSMQRPLGPVVVFGASNFPLAFSVAGGDTASALAAGCPVIVKAHPAHPGTSEIVGQAILKAAEETGMPAGVFALLFDAGIEVGQSLVQHPLVQAVGFTGSLAAGRKLFDLAAAREEPIPVYAEMGSTNPQFLLPQALAARGHAIAEGLHQSITMGVGQFCTKPGVVFYDGNAAFRDRLVQLVSESAPGCMLNERIAQHFAEGVDEIRNHPDVSTLVDAETGEGASGVRPYLYETTVDAFLSDPTLRQECFGPMALLVKYRDRSELLRVAREMAGQLTASLHAEAGDLSASKELLAWLEQRVGRLVVNQFPTGVDVGHAMIHGGPYPATTAPRTTSVGATAIYRFTRPICYQNVPDAALPAELQAANPLGIRRLVDGKPEAK